MSELITRREMAVGILATAILLPAAPTDAFVPTPSLRDNLVRPAAIWLAGQFGDVFRAKLRDTPFSVAMLCAFACQESGYTWYNRAFRHTYRGSELLRLLVLDNTAPRSVFPRDTRAFMADPAFGDISAALIQASDASRRARGRRETGELLYGYGLFQYDLQHIREDPDFWRSPAPDSNVSGQIGLWGDAGACVDRWRAIFEPAYQAAHGNFTRAAALYNGGGANSRIYGNIVARFLRLIGDAL